MLFFDDRRKVFPFSFSFFGLNSMEDEVLSIVVALTHLAWCDNVISNLFMTIFTPNVYNSTITKVVFFNSTDFDHILCPEVSAEAFDARIGC